MKKATIVLCILLLNSGCFQTGKSVAKKFVNTGNTNQGGTQDPVTCGVPVTALSLESPAEGIELGNENAEISGECESDRGSVRLEGSFPSSVAEVDCIDDRYSAVVSFENMFSSNKLRVSQADQEIEREVRVFRKVAYCGDGEVNQVWEKCDGGRNCNEYCHLMDEPEERDVVLARVVFDKTFDSGAGFVEPYVFLGTPKGAIPSGKWFLVEGPGTIFFNDGKPSHLGNVPGLAVTRERGHLHVHLEGGMRRGLAGGPGLPPGMEHVRGYIEYYRASASKVAGHPDFRMEQGSDGICEAQARQDEVGIADGRVNFCMTVTSHHDSFSTTYESH